MWKERGRGKGTDTKQVEQKKSDQHLASLQAMASLKSKMFSLQLSARMKWYDIKCPFGQFGLFLPAVFPASLLPNHAW